MRSHTEHAAIVAELVTPLLLQLADRDPEMLAIDDAGLDGRVVAHDILAAIPLPPFDNSQMDGYAVRTADFSGDGPFTFVVGPTAAAGVAPFSCSPGSACPVMTGAAIPFEADAVIPIEQADPPRFGLLQRMGAAATPGAAPAYDAETVTFSHAPQPGAFVREQGSDHAGDAPLVLRGSRLRPSSIGLLASAGVAMVPVLPRPRVLLLSTGDEITAPGGRLAPGRIYDANAPLLAAALRAAGAEVTVHRVADQPGALLACIAAAGEHDLLVTSGGISAGAFEVVRDAFGGDPHTENDPSSIAFTAIALQPGGPQGAGFVAVNGRRLATLCFPGNPVSSALSAELFLLPLLRAHAGIPEHGQRSTARLAHETDSPEHKHQVRRGRFLDDGSVELSPPSSHLLSDLATAELLAHIPVGVAYLAAGSPIEIQRFDV
ncbi:gephyrin-like molybdotransferase Glp [Leucobacter sp. NPDC077196]|uniref:molybdopterin molybdotransferase MoeA n=1 Tax=Leucobacter sp. NPDC077196 TaxID=3154959 RepID=UPI0034494B7B